MRRRRTETILACGLALLQLAFAGFLAGKGGADQTSDAARHAAAYTEGTQIVLALSDFVLIKEPSGNRCPAQISIKRLFWNDARGDRCCVLSSNDDGRYALGETRRKPPEQGLWVELDRIAKAYDAYGLSPQDGRALIESVDRRYVYENENRVFFDEEAIGTFTLCARVFEGEIVFTGLSCAGTVYPLTEFG